MKTSDHKCPVPDCTTRVAYNRLMCRPHWGYTTRPERAAYARAWRNRDHDKKAWLEAAAVICAAAKMHEMEFRP